MGYEVELFSSRQDAEKYICAVCQGVAKEVCETECGHLFCRSCVSRLIRVCSRNEKANCPHCRAAITWNLVHPSKFLDREIANLKVICNLCNQWNGNLSTIAGHKTKDCSMMIVDCPWIEYGCKEKIARKDINAHLENSKVAHLELKIQFLQTEREITVNNLIRKYESELSATDLRWKQKFLDLHKQFSKSEAAAGESLSKSAEKLRISEPAQKRRRMQSSGGAANSGHFSMNFEFKSDTNGETTTNNANPSAISARLTASMPTLSTASGESNENHNNNNRESNRETSVSSTSSDDLATRISRRMKNNKLKRTFEELTNSSVATIATPSTLTTSSPATIGARNDTSIWHPMITIATDPTDASTHDSNGLISSSLTTATTNTTSAASSTGIAAAASHHSSLHYLRSPSKTKKNQSSDVISHQSAMAVIPTMSVASLSSAVNRSKKKHKSNNARRKMKGSLAATFVTDNEDSSGSGATHAGVSSLTEGRTRVTKNEKKTNVSKTHRSTTKGRKRSRRRRSGLSMDNNDDSSSDDEYVLPSAMLQLSDDE